LTDSAVYGGVLAECETSLAIDIIKNIDTFSLAETNWAVA
jgi:hypothetical protein